MAAALAGNNENQKAGNQLANQAQRVLSHLSRMQVDKSHGPVKSVGELSKTAEQKLRQLKERGVDLNKFYTQYDPNRSGCVSYKDFSDTLLAMSSGIGREDALILASTLDKKKTGQIEYKSILASLNEIQNDKSLATSTAKLSSKSSNNNANESETMSYSAMYATRNSTNSSEPKFRSTTPNKYNSFNTTTDNEGDSSYLKMYQSRVNPFHNLAPSEVVNVQILSPSKSASKSSKTEISEDEKLFYSGRRLYHQENESDCQVKRIIASRLNERTAPFYVDLSVEEAKKSRPKRSLSAPPRTIPLAQMIAQGSTTQDAPPLPRPNIVSSSDSPPKKSSRLSSSTSSTQEDYNKKSIRAALEKKISTSPSGKSIGGAEEDEQKHKLAKQHEEIIKKR